MFDNYAASRVGLLMLDQYLKETSKDQEIKETVETGKNKAPKEKKQKTAKHRFLALLGQH